MAIYRINLYNTFDNILNRKAFSVPSSAHPIYTELSEASQWGIVESIKKGNLLLLCRGVRYISAIAYANDDCRITDVDAFKEAMKYQEQGFRFVSFDVYKLFPYAFDGKTLFQNLLLNKPFEDKEFCIQLVAKPDKQLLFTEAANKLLEA